jgi:hypothetical protein
METGEEIGARPEFAATTSDNDQGDSRLGRYQEEALDAEGWPKLTTLPAIAIYGKSNKLNIVYGDINEQDLINATLSDDEQIQITLLVNLFEACGLRGENQHKERALLVKEIAALAPRNERERNLIYHRAIANHLATWCARGIFTEGPPIQTALTMAGMFQKLSGHYIVIDDKLAGMRAESAIRDGPIIDHPEIESGEGCRLALARSPNNNTPHAPQWNGGDLDGRPAQRLDLSGSRELVDEYGGPCSCAAPDECGHGLI